MSTKQPSGQSAKVEFRAPLEDRFAFILTPGAVEFLIELHRRQIDKQLPDFSPTPADLLRIPEGAITEAGLKRNVAVSIGYLEAWVRSIGCVPLLNLMADAATAEISRSQLWQWVHHGGVPADGRPVTAELCLHYIDAEPKRPRGVVEHSRYRAYEKAASRLRSLIGSNTFTEFLTLPHAIA